MLQGQFSGLTWVLVLACFMTTWAMEARHPPDKGETEESGICTVCLEGGNTSKFPCGSPVPHVVCGPCRSRWNQRYIQQLKENHKFKPGVVYRDPCPICMRPSMTRREQANQRQTRTDAEARVPAEVEEQHSDAEQHSVPLVEEAEPAGEDAVEDINESDADGDTKAKGNTNRRGQRKPKLSKRTRRRQNRKQRGEQPAINQGEQEPCRQMAVDQDIARQMAADREWNPMPTPPELIWKRHALAKLFDLNDHNTFELAEAGAFHPEYLNSSMEADLKTTPPLNDPKAWLEKHYDSIPQIRKWRGPHLIRKPRTTIQRQTDTRQIEKYAERFASDETFVWPMGEARFPLHIRYGRVEWHSKLYEVGWQKTETGGRLMFRLWENTEGKDDFLFPWKKEKEAAELDRIYDENKTLEIAMADLRDDLRKQE